MIIGRFRVQCRPEQDDEIAAAITAVVAPSRTIPDVVHFDVARSVSEPNTFLAFEVFATQEAFDRQNAQPEVAKLLSLIDPGGFEWTTWEMPERQ